MSQCPVAIGGVGGSGTRVVAAALAKLGYFIGHDINEANDNLQFTFLFKREEILEISQTEFSKTLGIFLRLMSGGALSQADIDYAALLALTPRWDAHSVSWLQQRVRNLQMVPALQSLPYAWKEPNTHVVLDRLWGELPDLKYIHVRRHGLDMAFSSNQNQPKFWGERLLGCVGTPGDPVYSAEYWCAAEERVIKIAEDMGKTNCLHVVSFERLCASPEAEFIALLKFLGFKQDSELAAELSGLVVAPPTIGRFRNHDCSLFPLDLVCRVRGLCE